MAHLFHQILHERMYENVVSVVYDVGTQKLKFVAPMPEQDKLGPQQCISLRGQEAQINALWWSLIVLRWVQRIQFLGTLQISDCRLLVQPVITGTKNPGFGTTKHSKMPDWKLFNIILWGYICKSLINISFSGTRTLSMMAHGLTKYEWNWAIPHD